MISRLTTAALLVSFLLVYPGPAYAAEFRSGFEVVISSSEVLDEDVYAVASRIIVDGAINGDLLAAGESIEINGAVNGDLIAAARSIVVNGVVEDDVRAAGAELQFQSSIGEDLIAAGNHITIVRGAVIGQDLVAGANTVDVSGDIKGNLELDATEARIAGAVGGDIQATVAEQLTLAPAVRIRGQLNYTSANEVTVQPGAEVLGGVTQDLPVLEMFGNEYPVSAVIVFISRFIEQAKWFTGTLLVGLALIWLYPGTLNSVLDTFKKSPLKSLGFGVLILPIMPLIFLFVLIAILSSVGFSAFPIVAIPAILYACMLLLAKPVIALLIGDYFARRIRNRSKPSPVGALAFGAAVLAILGLIPYVDTFIRWLTLFSGFGMWLLFISRHYRAAKTSAAR